MVFKRLIIEILDSNSKEEIIDLNDTVTKLSEQANIKGQKTAQFGQGMTCSVQKDMH